MTTYSYKILNIFALRNRWNDWLRALLMDSLRFLKVTKKSHAGIFGGSGVESHVNSFTLMRYKFNFRHSLPVNFIRFLIGSTLALLVCTVSQADTQLDYNNDFSTSAELPGTRIAHAYFHNVKVNADLIDDFCYLDSENHTLSCSVSENGVAGKYFASKVLDQSGWFNSYMMADINNDGRTDFCQLVDNWTKLQCYISKGDGANLTFEKLFTSEYLDGGWAGYRWLVDVDSDGRADFCRLIGSKDYYLSCRKMGSNGLSSKEYLSTRLPGWPVDNVMHWFASSSDGLLSLHGFFDNGNDKAMLIRFKNRTNEGGGFTGQSTSIILSKNERVGTAVTNAQGPGSGAYCYLKNGSNLYCEDMDTAVSGKTKAYVNQEIDDAGWPDSREWIDVNGDGLIDYCALVYANTQMSCWIQSDKGKFENRKSVYIDGGYSWNSRGTQSHTGITDTRVWAQVDGIYKAYSRLVYANNAYRLNTLATSSTTDDTCKATSWVSTPKNNRIARTPSSPPIPEPQVRVVYRYDERDPQIIFSHGFQARGDNTDLLDHIDGQFRSAQTDLYRPDQLLAMNSAYVATTASTDFIMDRVLAYFNQTYRTYRNLPEANIRNQFPVYEIQASDRMFSLRNSFIQGWDEGFSSSSIRSDQFEDAWNRFIAPAAGSGRLPQQEWLALGGVASSDIRSVTVYSIPDGFFDSGDAMRRVTVGDLIRSQLSNANFVLRSNPLTSRYARDVHASQPSPGANVILQAVGETSASYQQERRLNWPLAIAGQLRGAAARFSCLGAAQESFNGSAPSSIAPACVSVTLRPGSDGRIRPIGEYQARHPCSP